MIGSILADSGVVFDCGPCNSTALGVRCCIYRMGTVPLAYDCVGTEIIGVKEYSWKEIWQCSYGCCKNKCCRSDDETTTTIGTTTMPASSTTVPSSTTSSTIALTTTSSTITTTTTTLSGYGEICVDCCKIGQGECKMLCVGGTSQSSGSIITGCSYDGSTVRIKRGQSSSQTLSCLDGRCAGTRPSTTSAATTTTTTAITTTQATSTSAPSTSTIASTTTSSTSTTTTIASGARITILYLPVDWTGTRAAFNSIVSNQVSYLINNIPLKACPSKVKAITINNSCAVNVPADWNSCYADAGRILTSIGNCAKATGQKYDYVIGLSGANLCAGRGFTSFSSPYVYLAGDEPRKTTHELGHQWSLGDEYYDTCRCFLTQFPQCTHNCLDSSLGGEDPVTGYTPEYCAAGSLCPDQIGVSTCFGNKNPINTRCIMGTDYTGNTREFCEHCSDYLATLSLLKC
ncbi:MAG: hypothetical protein WAX07_09555 [Candidatus Altiarchaeia archaeon]